MQARDETILFSAIAILLASLMLGGLADLVSADAHAVANTRELQVSRPAANERELRASGDTVCSSAATAPAQRSEAGQPG